MPLFSVIIPAYNAESTLNEALESVWHQTEQDFEVIVINDGSNDGTLEILKTWQKRWGDEKFDFRNQPNRGLGNARNRGIQIAKGAYIALLDADDTWTPNKLQELKRHWNKHPETEAIFHQVRNVGLKRKRIRKAYLPKNQAELLIRGNPIVPSAFSMRTGLFKSYSFSEKPDFHGAEDLHLWVRLMIAQTQMAYLPKPLTNYRETAGMSSRLGEHLRKVENVLDYFYQGEDINKQTYRRAFQRKQYEAARFCQKRGLFTKAEDYYVSSGLKNPKIWILRLLNFFGLAL